MGGIVGAGIFMNPSVVAQRAHTAPLILSAWVIGALIALAGGFIFAELAWRHSSAGGLYAYMRDAFHPVVGFMYGWTALLVSQSGGMAAAAVTFAAYFLPLTGLHWAPAWVAIAAIVLLSLINCTGVREGGTTQDILMVLKCVVIGAIVGAAFFGPHAAWRGGPFFPAGTAAGIVPFLAIMGASLVPVLYAYDGWQTAPFIDGELKDSAKTLPVAMVLGVVAVV
ncbi:MAG: amino acid permease, partial [Candidatus Eremiobacteraeota bacterium]|nr:amino acid permease [Candidatus Eremiobacteraeota bacterium]